MFVECKHQGQRYKWLSDRFYLDEVEKNVKSPLSIAFGDESDEEEPMCPSFGCKVSPYFCRGALVGSLIAQNSLEACVLMTYSCRLSCLKKEFPTLFETEVIFALPSRHPLPR